MGSWSGYKAPQKNIDLLDEIRHLVEDRRCR